MKNAFWLMANMLKVSFRRKGTIFVFFVLPIIGIVLSSGIYNGLGSAPTRLGIIDHDHSETSKRLIGALKEEEQFRIVQVPEQAPNIPIASGKVDVVLVIPAELEGRIIRQETVNVNLISMKGEMVTAWVRNYLNMSIQNLTDIAKVSRGNPATFHSIADQVRSHRNMLMIGKVADRVKNKGMTTGSIGFLILFMMIGAGNTVEMILESKRDRTYYRICASPVNAKTYIVGNVLANLVIIVIQVILVLVILTRVFRIETYIPFYQMCVALICFGFVSIGLGLAIVAFAQDSLQANTMQTLITIPTCMLSGCFWPVDIMPKSLQRVADLLPQRWAIMSVQKLQEGGGLPHAALQLSVVLSFALALFLVAAYKIKRNDNVQSFV